MPNLAIPSLTSVGSLAAGNYLHAVVGGNSRKVDFASFKYSVDTNPTFKPQDYGTIDRSGVNDSSTAFIACWNAANAAGRGKIEIPSGIFLINNQLPLLLGGFKIEGAGKGVTFLRFNHAGVGFRSQLQLSTGAVFSVQAMTMQPYNAGCTIAIDILNTPAAGSPSFNTAIVRDISFSLGSFSWTTGSLHFYDMEIVQMFNCDCFGGYSLVTPNYGVKQDGFSLSLHVTDCNIHGVNRGVWKAGTSEGLYVRGSEFIACDYGVYINHDPGNEGWAIVTGNHMNCYKGGIYSAGSSGGVYSNNLIWGLAISPYDSGWVGIELFGSTGALNGEYLILDNFLNGYNGVLGYAGPTKAVKLDGTILRTTIGGGNMNYCDVGISIEHINCIGTVIKPVIYFNVTTELSDVGLNTCKSGWNYSTGYSFSQDVKVTGDVIASTGMSAGGDITLTNLTSRKLAFGAVGVAAPGASSLGQKITLYGGATPAAADYAIGIGTFSFWFNAAAAANYHWYFNSVAKLSCNTSALYPTTNDGLILGGVSNAFSDIFLASGAVIYWAGTAVSLTHSSNLLTFSSPVALNGVTTPIDLSGGVTGAAPAPQITMGSYYNNAAVTVSHLDLYGGTIGWGITPGTLNHIAGTSAGHSFYVNGALTAAKFSISYLGSVVIGSAAIATNATDGFLYIPTCAGPPTGVPSALTGRVALVYDATNNKFYIYNGAWKGGTAPGAWT